MGSNGADGVSGGGSELTQTLPDGSCLPVFTTQLDARVGRLGEFLEERKDDEDDLMTHLRDAYAICVDFARERMSLTNRFQQLDGKYQRHVNEGMAAIARLKENIRECKARQRELEQERGRLERELDAPPHGGSGVDGELDGVQRLIKELRPRAWATRDVWLAAHGAGDDEQGGIDTTEQLRLAQREATAGEVALRRTRRDLAMAQGDCKSRARVPPGPARRRARSIGV